MPLSKPNPSVMLIDPVIASTVTSPMVMSMLIRL